jgi:hypothetical protein
MEQEGKIKALKKVIDMLVVPKVNELEPLSGFKIKSVRVELTSYGKRNNEPDFQIYVDLTNTPKFDRAGHGMGQLILNVAEYIDPYCELVIYFSEWGSDIEFQNVYAGSSTMFRQTNDRSIKQITGEHG